MGSPNNFNVRLRFWRPKKMHEIYSKVFKLGVLCRCRTFLGFLKPNWWPWHRQCNEDRMQALRTTVRDSSRLTKPTGTDRYRLGERAERTLRGWPCVSDICQSRGDRQPTILPGDTVAYHYKVSTVSYGRSRIIQIAKNAVACNKVNPGSAVAYNMKVNTCWYSAFAPKIGTQPYRYRYRYCTKLSSEDYVRIISCQPFRSNVVVCYIFLRFRYISLGASFHSG